MTAGVIRKCQAKTESTTLSLEFSDGNDLRMEWMRVQPFVAVEVGIIRVQV